MDRSLLTIALLLIACPAIFAQTSGSLAVLDAEGKAKAMCP
jgi:hypothetical protein